LEQNMTTIGIRELRSQASRLIRLVRDKGESGEVTYHGKVVARLVPVRPESGTNPQAWADLDKLAEEIGKAWQGTPNAILAVREGRRNYDAG
jgi:prevent-host-death family protein